MISAALRDYLIEHLDGPVPMNAKSQKVRREAIAQRLVTPARWCRHSSQLRQTELTPHGREALAKALGDWIDALVRAQLGGLR
jgi:hypothetical protein